MRFYLTRETLAVFSPFSNAFSQGIRGKISSGVEADYAPNEMDEGYDDSISQMLQHTRDMFQDFYGMDIRILILNEYDLPSSGVLQLQENHPLLESANKLSCIESVKVKVTFSHLQLQNGMNYNETEFPNITTKEMVVQENGATICQDADLKFPNKATFDLFSQCGIIFSARVTIQVAINIKDVKSPKPSNLNTYKKMLHDEIFTDMVIISGDGKRINCHKSILAACSPYFMAMFNSEMAESQTNEIKRPDLTENCVNALLRYIYYLCEEEPQGNCQIAFELFVAANKMQDVAPDLKTTMTTILLTKPVDWYEVEVALELYHFAAMLHDSEGAQLKLKAFQVIQQHKDTPTKLCEIWAQIQQNSTMETV